jgi:uncharacterized protein (DUF1501 family)
MAYINRNVSRRLFLQRAGALSVAAGTPFLANLAGIGAASAQAADDYKALVCVFLHGGNDQSNTVIPYDAASYAGYETGRPSLAIPRADLAATVLNSTTPLAGRELAFNPALAPLHTLFDAGKLAVVSNVGVLRYPVNKAQYQTKSVPLPPQLFSHSDHQAFWQTAAPEGTVRTGWGGRMGDLLAAQNTGALSICLSVAGNNAFQNGDQVVQLQLGTGGTVPIYGTSWPYGNQVAGDQVKANLTRARTHALEQQWVNVAKRAMDADTLVRGALTGAPDLTTVFDDQNWLAKQLKMVARMIQVRQTLGMKRQIYFVSLGGWDHHQDLVTEHPAKLGQLAAAMSSFYAATVELGVANNVTTFTASDFGRALQHNGRGSDHGWGSHQMVMGGAVRGKQIYGTFPTVALAGPEDAGQGRLIPTTAVDEYAATMAKWMGVSNTNLSTVIPNIGRFTRPDLGFMTV